MKKAIFAVLSLVALGLFLRRFDWLGTLLGQGGDLAAEGAAERDNQARDPRVRLRNDIQYALEDGSLHVSGIVENDNVFDVVDVHVTLTANHLVMGDVRIPEIARKAKRPLDERLWPMGRYAISQYSLDVFDFRRP